MKLSSTSLVVWRTISGLLLGLAGGLIQAAEPLVVEQAWIREGPPSAAVLAGYMQINNPGPQAQVIKAVTSDRFRGVEIHRTEVVDGVARMLPQAQLEIGAGETLQLTPGGLHLMLMQAHTPLREGDRVDLILELAEGTQVPVTAVVRRADDATTDHSHHHHH